MRCISSAGEMKWRTQDIFVSRVLAGEMVGLREVEEDLYELYYGGLLLGWLDSAERCFVADRAPRWHGKNNRECDPPTGGGTHEQV